MLGCEQIFVSRESETAKSVAVDISAFPNPVKNTCNFECYLPEKHAGFNAVLKLFTAEGKMLKIMLLNLSTGENSFQMDISHLPPGNYYYKLESDGKPLASKQLIVQK
ncbi:MAG: T9SS type A sorting domain-containing protein [Bacteroidota bacterium]|nr:T9SS type A sorting domain-containing protein [Bacteroidota bacterium]